MPPRWLLALVVVWLVVGVTLNVVLQLLLH
jgi:hypothetical protein